VQNSGNITGHQDRDYEQSSLWVELVFPYIMFFSGKTFLLADQILLLGKTGLRVDQVLGTLEYEILLESLLCLVRGCSWASFSKMRSSLLFCLGCPAQESSPFPEQLLQ